MFNDGEPLSEEEHSNSNKEMESQRILSTDSGIDTKLDAISHYVVKLMEDDVIVNEGRAWKLLRISAKLVAFILGALAGFPWLHSGKLAAEAITSNLILSKFLEYTIGALCASPSETKVW